MQKFNKKIQEILHNYYSFRNFLKNGIDILFNFILQNFIDMYNTKYKIVQNINKTKTFESCVILNTFYLQIL